MTYEALQNGHRNILTNALLLFYQAGHRGQAQKIYNQLRELYPRAEFEVPLVNYARKRLLEELESINRDIPQIKIITIIDTSDYIQRSIRNVGSSAIYGGILAIIVLLVFLRNFRSTVIIATAIPVSIIATFALLYFGGFTLNIMTLGGLALGIGMLVDNAIVVLENIFRMRESGDFSERAAIEGAEEVTSAIIASTLTTMVVFLPLIFIRGMSGIMFKQLSIDVAFSLFCSLGAALTLVPMLSVRILPSAAAHILWRFPAPPSFPV